MPCRGVSIGAKASQRSVSGSQASEALVVRHAVLFDEAAEGIEPLAERGHAHVVGAARQLRQFFPAVSGGVVGMVIGLVDTLFGIPTHHVHAIAVGHRPRHLGARNGKRRARPPLALHLGARRRAVAHRLLRVQFRQVDSPGLVQAFELPAVVAMRLGAQQGGGA
jgi:hypothetical protein